jgi:hypothetical protein
VATVPQSEVVGRSGSATLAETSKDPPPELGYQLSHMTALVIVTTGGWFVPVAVTVASAAGPRRSVTRTVTATSPGRSITQLAVFAVPEAQPDQAYVRSPVELEAPPVLETSASTPTLQGAEGLG